ncbi:hypothetical protein EOD42_20205 [Rhodovarius crocodyli]|uniref:Uncharacterized protein n=1 Tax=Rhodovarius crocodyli TaxID=1979269 RepID=A0A437M3C5_9PROT|nr:hypothetical protein [Rhodovarius crocodyli]RVT92055.1 hypothetical protein EOD42_20205 [Rhodovarius crocodyli]
MADSRTVKTSFTAGELAPELLGRADLRAYANGARKLTNVFIQPTGGLTRRPGLRHIATLPGYARLIAFEFNTEQTYLLVLTDRLMSVYMGDAQVAQLASPWALSQLSQLSFTQSADTLLICHPDVDPKRVTRSSHTAWTIDAWPWVEVPTHRFVDAGVSMTPSATTGTITLTAGGNVFLAGHAGQRWLIQGKRVDIVSIASPTTATANVLDTLPGIAATKDWEESAFSTIHGWPVTVCFHQDRLVIGGSRDLPNRLWLSRSGDLFNFDLGTGLDDQGISFGLVSDQVNAIRGVFSGRHLQVFTSGGEWMVTGDPLTPSSIQLNRQTRVGSMVARMVPPVDVDGSTIFAARSGTSIYEFAYTDVQQVYQANDLALVSQHLMRTPVSMAYDQRRRLLHVAMDDGSLATLTLYRDEQVTAWTGQSTQGSFVMLAEVEGTVYAVTWRWGVFRLERFDPELTLDAALTGTAGAPQLTWSGLSHLEGHEAAILADGAPRDSQVVDNGAVVLDDGATALQVGLAYTHMIEPLPPELLGVGGARSVPLRLVAVTFRLLNTSALTVDVGRGAQPVPFRRLDTNMLDAAPPVFTGDVRLRALGWRRDATRPLWRIEDSTPLPFTLLSITTEMRITD